MAYEQREGQGALFKNNEKENDKHPDYRGDALIGGKPHWVAGWIKKGKKGSFLSLSIKPKEHNGKRQGGPQEESDVPF